MKITDIESIILKSPYEYGMETDASDSHGPAYACIIKVHTDEGITGIGDIDSHPQVMKSIIEAPRLIPAFSEGLKNALIGENPLETDRLWHKMYEYGFYHGRRGAVIQAMSGIDIALWDIRGKVMKETLSTALGGRYHDKIRAYASTLFRDTPDGMKKAVEKYRDLGYTAIKFGWGAFTQDPIKGIQLVKAAREEAGDKIDIMVDGYITRHDIKFAAYIIQKLGEYNIYWMEEPLPSDNLKGFRDLVVRVDTRIACGEQYGSRFEYEQLLEEVGPDIVQFDISRCGGITEAKHIVFMAEMKNHSFCPHAWTSDILTSASLHINASSRYPTFQEFCTNDSPISRDLCVNPITLDADGYIKVPERPGLGIELDEDIIKKYRID